MARLQNTGKINFLRVNDVGGGFGPDDDKINVEVVTRISSAPKRAMGFQLRNDKHRAARQGMLDLLRDAFTHGHTAVIDYDLDDGKQNGMLVRVALKK